MIGIRASRGLGDAIHLRAAVLHLLQRGEEVVVFTMFPVVFADLPVTTRPIMDGNKYSNGLLAFVNTTKEPTVDNFAGACRTAGIDETIALQIGWKVQHPRLLEKIKARAAGRKIFIFQPMKKPRNAAQELLRPSQEAYNKFIDEHKDYYRIMLGKRGYVERRDEPCDLDLFDKTTIPQAFDIGTIGDLFFGESCYVPMLGEAMDKRFAIMFTRRSLEAGETPNVTPQRLFHKKHLATEVYDET